MNLALLPPSDNPLHFYCSDQTWKDVNSTEYFLTPSGQYILGNEDMKFLRGDGKERFMWFGNIPGSLECPKVALPKYGSEPSIINKIVFEFQWNDNNDQSGLRPPYGTTFQLCREDVEIIEFTVPDDGYRREYSSSELPASGALISFRNKFEIDGYTVSYKLFVKDNTAYFYAFANLDAEPDLPDLPDFPDFPDPPDPPDPPSPDYSEKFETTIVLDCNTETVSLKDGEFELHLIGENYTSEKGWEVLEVWQYFFNKQFISLDEVKALMESPNEANEYIESNAINPTAVSRLDPYGEATFGGDLQGNCVYLIRLDQEAIVFDGNVYTVDPIVFIATEPEMVIKPTINKLEFPKFETNVTIAVKYQDKALSGVSLRLYKLCSDYNAYTGGVAEDEWIDFFDSKEVGSWYQYYLEENPDEVNSYITSKNISASATKTLDSQGTVTFENISGRGLYFIPSVVMRQASYVYTSDNFVFLVDTENPTYSPNVTRTASRPQVGG